MTDDAPTLHLERFLARTPFGEAWAARAAGGTEVTAVLIAPELETLVVNRAHLVAALQHRLGLPHTTDDVLVPLLDVVEAPDGRLALLLPPEERAPASVRLERGRTYPTTEVAAAARAVGIALQQAHAAGTRHGALCPGVLYLGEGQPPRLVGHGWVDAFVEAGAGRTGVLATMGARGFAAPELVHPQAERGTPGPANTADVYAMGAMLYACMTGRPPFGGRTTAMTMAAVLADEALSGEMPQVPRGDPAAMAEQAATSERLTTALLRAVERAPEDRWPTAGDFVRALEPRASTPAPVAAHAAPMKKAWGCMTSVVLFVLLAGFSASMMAMR